MMFTSLSVIKISAYIITTTLLTGVFKYITGLIAITLEVLLR